VNLCSILFRNSTQERRRLLETTDHCFVVVSALCWIYIT